MNLTKVWKSAAIAAAWVASGSSAHAAEQSYQCVAVAGTDRGAVLGIHLSEDRYARLDYAQSCVGRRIQGRVATFAGFRSCGSQDGTAQLRVDPGMLSGASQGEATLSSDGTHPFLTRYACERAESNTGL